MSDTRREVERSDESWAKHNRDTKTERSFPGTRPREFLGPTGGAEPKGT
jgi:hypothetical protein